VDLSNSDKSSPFTVVTPVLLPTQVPVWAPAKLAELLGALGGSISLEFQQSCHARFRPPDRTKSRRSQDLAVITRADWITLEPKQNCNLQSANCRLASELVRAISPIVALRQAYVAKR
jgi:hypothetical protein